MNASLILESRDDSPAVVTWTEETNTPMSLPYLTVFYFSIKKYHGKCSTVFLYSAQRIAHCEVDGMGFCFTNEI